MTHHPKDGKSVSQKELLRYMNGLSDFWSSWLPDYIFTNFFEPMQQTLKTRVLNIKLTEWS